ncbi:ATP-binding protein [uncultured Streptomyces sp.]|uniref:ATP-binding protein n=1 Tax=uncultured Streptomyces sp. TaxID=174707 RepID=UPI0026241602|nr:ATP-binding protein [uncultured Streptomyces sp.]
MIRTEGDRAEWTFPASPGAVREARHVVRDTLRAWELPPSTVDMTVLLVSELVTNSLKHATGPIGVRLTRPGAESPDGPGHDGPGHDGARPRGTRPDPGLRDGGSPERTGGRGPGHGHGRGHSRDHGAVQGTGLVVEVSDPLPDLPTERVAGPDDEGGRGLQLVACSARRWGTRHGKNGKTVWFELPLPG